MSGYAINSYVYDIKQDVPTDKDLFFVDTNVWYWLTYQKASMGDRPPEIYQSTDYPAYISQACNNKAKLLRCGLNLSELAHLIERCEFEIFKKTTKGAGQTPLKSFRHDPVKRMETVREIHAAWGLVKGMSTAIEILIDDPMCDNFIKLINTSCLDGYDAYMALRGLKVNSNFAIITDDADFSSIPKIRVFTSNRQLISDAKKRHKFVSR